MSKHLELARKIKALAEKGTGGEKINAETILNALMKKHNISIADLEGEKTNDYFFTLEEKKHKSEFDLWYQIVKLVNYDLKVYGEFPKKVIKKYLLAGNWMLTCTVSEYIQIKAMYDFYKKLYLQEIDIFYSAFLKANNLLVDCPGSDANKEMTKEDYEKWKRVDNISSNIKSGTFRKQLK